jgi:hypothetical protein
MLKTATSFTQPRTNQNLGLTTAKYGAVVPHARSGGYRIPDFNLDLSTQVDNTVLKNGGEFTRKHVIQAMKSLKALDTDQSLTHRDFVFEHLSALAKSELEGLPYKVPSDVLQALGKHSIIEKRPSAEGRLLSEAMASTVAASVKKEDARIELNTPILLYRLNLQDKLASIQKNWPDQIVDTSKQRGAKIPLTGEDFNSLANTLGEDVEVQLTGKSVIKEHLPWLYEFYNNDIRGIVSKVFGRPLHPTSEAVASKDAGLVINYTPPGKAYENHVDSNPVTAVLYTQDMKPGQGGLVLHPEGKNLVLTPKKGDVFIFDGRQVPHEVQPTKKGRASVPMDFYVAKEKQWRHPGTDELVINGNDADS